MKSLRPYLRFLPLSVALAAAFALPAQAQSLLDLYESARGLRRDLAVGQGPVRRQPVPRRAGPGRHPAVGQPRGGRHAIELRRAMSPSPTAPFTTQSATLSATQPLYRPANFATYEQGKRQVELAQAQLTAASQDLIVRVSQAYFDVLAAQDTLTFVRAQKAAVAEQLASAKRNFEVGTSTITDTREAQARYDLVHRAGDRRPRTTCASSGSRSTRWSASPTSTPTRWRCR